MKLWLGRGGRFVGVQAYKRADRRSACRVPPFQTNMANKHVKRRKGREMTSQQNRLIRWEVGREIERKFMA